MNRRYIKECICEFRKLQKKQKKDEYHLIKAALFVEDVFGITLHEEEICEKTLGNAKSLENFVLTKLRLV